jgi:aryl-alcohol dehydrogenase-like predicted oxidoreductase
MGSGAKFTPVMSNQMKYGTLPGIAKPVSRLVQGIIQVNRSDEAVGFAQLDSAFAAGINCIDTAYIYGNSDEFLGRWIRTREIRDNIVVLAKGAHDGIRKKVTPFDIQHDLHETLARMKLESVDLYVLHRDDENVAVEPIVDVLNLLQKEGKIHAFGGSNWSAERLKKANDYAEASGQTPFAVSSPNFSLADPVQVPWGGCVTISGDKFEADRDWYKANQMPIFSWSSMAGGFLSGRYNREGVEGYTEGQDKLVKDCYCSEANFTRLDRVAELATKKGLSVPQIALAYLFNYPMNVFALVGAQNQTEMDSNVAALNTALTEKEMLYLDLKSDTAE